MPGQQRRRASRRRHRRPPCSGTRLGHGASVNRPGRRSGRLVVGCYRSTRQIDGIVYEAIRDGTWGRVEACPEDACNYAFYDTSRNGSRVRCSMASCG
ncbi:CGNR zinc finger domain-containing protein [Micromonospora chersina]|uniref:CGNR zinc finger domain-containing protein n=1 Tax=Micromonospora chersina TaxID=47854 RepID=UPI00379842B0